MDLKHFLKILNSIDDLPTLPTIVLEVNKMLQDYDTSMDKLKETIEKDQAMVPKILKLVNSAFFGLPSKISNISRAITILGFNTVRNAIVSISIVESFSGKVFSVNFDINKFWIHSVAVAVTSKYLAKNTDYPAPEEAFTAGLLHDIGKIVLSQYFKDLFDKVWASCLSDQVSFYDAEKKNIPMAHPLIGSHLAKKWKLPTNLVDVIGCHHMLRKNVEDFDLLMLVHIADVIVNKFDEDLVYDIDISDVGREISNSMRDQLKTSPEWFPQVRDDIKLACQIFLED